MKRYVISDTHFNHSRILEYCQRPFDNVEQMNEVIINNWNKVINEDDIVYVLGDFCFGNKTMLKEIVSNLKGRKILICGNHDNLTKNAYYEAGFETVTKSPIIVDSDFILSHHPIQGDLGKFYNIHGHRHKLPSEAQFSPRHFDIGVDEILGYLRLGVDWHINNMVILDLDYIGSFGDKSISNSGMFNIKVV